MNNGNRAFILLFHYFSKARITCCLSWCLRGYSAQHAACWKLTILTYNGNRVALQIDFQYLQRNNRDQKSIPWIIHWALQAKRVLGKHSLAHAHTACCRIFQKYIWSRQMRTHPVQYNSLCTWQCCRDKGTSGSRSPSSNLPHCHSLVSKPSLLHVLLSHRWPDHTSRELPFQSGPEDRTMSSASLNNIQKKKTTGDRVLELTSPRSRIFFR